MRELVNVVSVNQPYVPQTESGERYFLSQILLEWEGPVGGRLLKFPKVVIVIKSFPSFFPGGLNPSQDSRSIACLWQSALSQREEDGGLLSSVR